MADESFPVGEVASHSVYHSVRNSSRNSALGECRHESIAVESILLTAK